MENQPLPPQQPVPAASAPAAVPADDASAGFWIRAGAYMIDGILVGGAGLLTMLVVGGAVGTVLRLVLSAAYFTVVPVINGGQTAGKMTAGIAIVKEDGSELTYLNTFVRWLGYLLSGLPAGLGFVCAAFTEHKRGLHDYVAGTRVVRVAPIGSGRKFLVIAAGLLLPLAAVLGIVAAIAIPKFADLTKKTGEGAAKGRLGSLRSAVAIYYGDTQGVYPQDLNLLEPKYLATIASPEVPDHHGVQGVEIYGAEVCSGSKEYGQELSADKLRDTGKWGYVNDPKAACYGQIFVDCTHKDTKGRPWYGF